MPSLAFVVTLTALSAHAGEDRVQDSALPDTASATTDGDAAVRVEGDEQAPVGEAKPKDYREGWGFAGLPLANFDSDDGFGYGVKVAAYDYGQNQKPYKTQLALQLFFTTRHVMYHKLYFDAPHFRGSPWRLDMTLKFDKVLLSNYYGIGNQAEIPHTNDIGDTSGLTEEEIDARDARVANYYTSYQSLEPSLILNLRRDLRGPFKLFNGYQFKVTRIIPHTAETLKEYTDIEVSPDWTSYLEETKPYGYSGGTMGYVQLGMVYDSRNREPSPERGSFSEASARGVYYRANAEDDRADNSPLYGGINLTTRNYFRVLPRLVLATRVVADLMFGDVPFNELSSFGGAQDYTGLGGSTSMRGVVARRYRGKIKVLATPELRFTPIVFYAAKQKFDIGLVAYSDLGRVWADYAQDGPLFNIHYAVGGGLRVAWNDNFLIRLDLGRDLEESRTGFYLTFDHAF